MEIQLQNNQNICLQGLVVLSSPKSSEKDNYKGVRLHLSESFNLNYEQN